MGRGVVYHNHSNSVDFILKSNNSAVALDAATVITLTLGTVLITGTAANATGHIRWAQAGYETGEVRLFLGEDTQVSPGSYDAPLVVYSATATAGVVWGKVGLIVKDDVEA
jgi:hypothetical protein